VFWWRIGLGGEDGGDGGAVVVWHGSWTTIVFDARMWCANCISYWKIWAVTCCLLLLLDVATGLRHFLLTAPAGKRERLREETYYHKFLHTRLNDVNKEDAAKN
jgi:hypothetical protein